MKTVVLGFSGGVDSAVCARLLKDSGFEVHGLYMDNTDAAALADAVNTAEYIGIPLRVVDVHRELDSLVCSRFAESYLRGDEVQGRGGKGMRNYRLTDKTGFVAGAAVVSDTDDIMLIESGGVILRTPAGSINIYGRDTQGVILMRVEAGSRLIAVQRVEGDLEEE